MRQYVVSPIIDRQTRIFVLGPPGAGKTTTSLLLARHLGGESLTTSTVLRRYKDEMALGPEKLLIAERLKAGQQHDTLRFYNFLWDNISRAAVPILLVDGFPRTSKAADHLLRKHASSEPKANILLLHVTAPTDICLSRFLSKSTANNASVFHARMMHYEKFERSIIRAMSDRFPLIETGSYGGTS